MMAEGERKGRAAAPTQASVAKGGRRRRAAAPSQAIMAMGGRTDSALSALSQPVLVDLCKPETDRQDKCTKKGIKLLQSRPQYLGHPVLKMKRSSGHSSSPVFLAQTNMKPLKLQKDILLKCGTSEELSILNSKQKKFYPGVVLSFVTSFQHTHGNLWSFAVEEKSFSHTNQHLVRFWSARSSRYCHVLLQAGRHYGGVAISLMKRELLFFDPKKVYDNTRNSRGVNGLVMSLDQFRGDTLIDKKGETILKGATVKKFGSLCNKIVQLEKNCCRVQLPWRIRVVNSFIHQINDFDCGPSVCFFFQTVSLGLPVCSDPVVKAVVSAGSPVTEHFPDFDGTKAFYDGYISDSDGRIHPTYGRKLENFREWIAYSVFVLRMLSY